MRLRTICIIGLVISLVACGIWAYGRGGTHAAVGAGGLPLIKADTSPVKLPPEEPEGEIIPNADSTVFSAMGTEGTVDPSMANIKPPEADTEAKVADTSEFAGFRTGFALPKPAERKAESLFGETGQTPEAAPAAEAPAEAPAAPASTGSKYLSGVAPEALQESTDAAPAQEVPVAIPGKTPAPEPQPVKKEVKAAPAPEPVAEPVIKTETEEPAPVEAPVAALPPSDDISARAQEAEEKILARPASKPPVPKLKNDEAEKKPQQLADVIGRVEDAKPEAVKPIETKKSEAPKAPEPKVEAPKEADIVAPIAAKNNFYIQLASAPKGADTQGQWQGLQGRYPQSLSGLTPSFQPVNIAGKGEYVRIQAGPMTQAEANKRCALLRQADPKGGCLVLRR